MSQNGVNKIDAMREQIGQFFGLREIATFESRPMSIFIVASFWIHLFFDSIFFFVYESRFPSSGEHGFELFTS